MRQRGVSVMEVLAVTAIICILAGLLIPVLNESRRKGGLVQSTSNLHQLLLASQLYSEDSNGHLPKGLFANVSPFDNYVKEKKIWACPLDPYPNGANWQASQRAKFRVSYDMPPLILDEYRSDFESLPNPGLFAAFHVGRALHALHTTPMYDFGDRYLLARRDGSVKILPVVLRCTKAKPHTAEANLWNLFVPEGDDPREVTQREFMDTTFQECIKW